jgi:hypothetical protein
MECKAAIKVSMFISLLPASGSAAVAMPVKPAIAGKKPKPVMSPAWTTTRRGRFFRFTDTAVLVFQSVFLFRIPQLSRDYG